REPWFPLQIPQMLRTIVMRAYGLPLLALCSSLLVGAAVTSQPPEESELREKSAVLFRDGNFREALDGVRTLVLNPDTDANRVSSDLVQAVQCLLQLGTVSEADALLESAATTHAKNWRLLRTVAQQYQQIPHHGFVIAGKFERGDHRGGGVRAHVSQRDRTRSLQLIRQAIALAADAEAPAA